MSQQPPTASLRILTPEGVEFGYTVATPLLRMCAWVIDAFVVNVAWGLISALIALLGFVSPDLASFVLIVGYFLASQGYRMVAEWRWRGQTLGKRVFRLRVIDSAGFPLTLQQTILRNLLRFADALPMAYLVGGTCALLNRKGQRLGDLAAGTVVIWEPKLAAPDLRHLAAGKYNSLREHPAVAARIRHHTTPEEARLAWQAIARRDSLSAEARIRVFAELAARFRSCGPLPAELVDGISDEQWVRNVVEVLFLTPSQQIAAANTAASSGQK